MQTFPTRWRSKIIKTGITGQILHCLKPLHGLQVHKVLNDTPLQVYMNIYFIGSSCRSAAVRAGTQAPGVLKISPKYFIIITFTSMYVVFKGGTFSLWNRHAWKISINSRRHSWHREKKRNSFAPWERAALSHGVNSDHDCVTKQTHAEGLLVGASCAKFVRVECLCVLEGQQSGHELLAHTERQQWLLY